MCAIFAASNVIVYERTVRRWKEPMIYSAPRGQRRALTWIVKGVVMISVPFELDDT